MNQMRAETWSFWGPPERIASIFFSNNAGSPTKKSEATFTSSISEFLPQQKLENDTL